MSLPAAQTPTMVGSGGEEAETNDFWTQNQSGMLVSIELRGSGLRMANLIGLPLYL